VEFRSHTRPSTSHPEPGAPVVTIENASEPQDKSGRLRRCPTPRGEREPGEVSLAHVPSAQSRGIFVAAECGSEWLSNLRPMQRTDLVIVVQQRKRCVKPICRDAFWAGMTRAWENGIRQKSEIG